MNNRTPRAGARAGSQITVLPDTMTSAGGPCLLCGAVSGKTAELLCGACLADLPTRPAGFCLCCGAPTPGAQACPHCFSPVPAFDCSIAACVYRYPVDRMIKRLKYQARIEMAEALCGPLLARIHATGVALPERLLPTPMHPRRYRRRGFNQALEIARILAKQLDIRVETRQLQRHRPTAAQYKLDAKQRIKNVAGAFILKKSISYERVAVVDDVLTSGATAHELARVLKQGGVRHVQVWSLARAGQPLS